MRTTFNGNEVTLDYTECGYWPDKEIVKLTLPELKGTPKQIKWAQEIREQAIRNIVSAWTNNFANDAYKDLADAIIKKYGTWQKVWEAIFDKALDENSALFVKSNKSWEIINNRHFVGM